MNNIKNNLILSNIKKASSGINIFSREYIFDEKYAKHRNALIPLWLLPIHSTRLSFLIRNGLTKKQRDEIFPSVFDLGNHRVVPRENCTYDHLVDELYAEKKDGVNANDAFETIQKSIFELTGRKIKSFSDANKSKTYKVLKLLKLLMKDYGNQSLMRLVRSPDTDKDFSLSFRDFGPYDQNQKQVFQIADLGSYLSAELDDRRFYSIKSTFYDLNNKGSDIIFSVENILINGKKIPTLGEVVRAYRFMCEAVDNYEVNVQHLNLDLDEELFIHLNRLEFLHFGSSFQPLIEASRPECKINIVHRELQDFTRKIFAGISNAPREIDPILSIDEIPNFLLTWQNEINTIVSKAFPQNFEVHDLKKLVASIQNILRYKYYFRSNGSGVLNEELRQISSWHVISAVCCANYAHNYRLSFKAYWLGQHKQSGSVSSSISKDFLNGNSIKENEFTYGIDNISEEHRTIITNCYEIIADTLRGHAELIDVRLLFRTAIVHKVMEICRTNDIHAISLALDDLAKFVSLNATNCTLGSTDNK